MLRYRADSRQRGHGRKALDLKTNLKSLLARGQAYKPVTPLAHPVCYNGRPDGGYVVEPSIKHPGHDLEEAIDIGPSSLNDISKIGQQIDAKLNNQVGRLIDRDPDRSVSVIRRWLTEN